MNVFNILLAIHITGGGLSLVLGSYAMLAKKGGRRHKAIGNIYFYAMLTASLVSLVMAALHPNYFLFIIGVFTAYMLLTGKRYLGKKSTADVTRVDWLITITMLIFALAFLGLGISYLLGGSLFGIVLAVFGITAGLFVSVDYRNYSGRSMLKNYWLTAHFQRMIGSYIASATAFLVVNNQVLPGVVAWLLPTAILTPLIVRWSKKYGVPKKLPAAA